MNKLILVRHGEAEHLLDRAHNRLDSLSQGRELADDACASFKFHGDNIARGE